MTTILVWGFWGLLILWGLTSISRSLDSRPCPACRQVISKQAIVCPHCRSVLS